MSLILEPLAGVDCHCPKTSTKFCTWNVVKRLHKNEGKLKKHTCCGSMLTQFRGSSSCLIAKVVDLTGCLSKLPMASSDQITQIIWTVFLENCFPIMEYKFCCP